MPQKQKHLRTNNQTLIKATTKNKKKLNKIISTMSLKENHTRTKKTTKNVPTRGKSTQQTKRTKYQEQKKRF